MPNHLSCTQSTVIYLYCPWLHQLAASTQLKVDKTCPIGYILDQILSQRSFKDIKQSDSSVTNTIGKRFEDVVPYHGGPQRWDIFSSYLLLRFSFWYRGPPSMATFSLGINGDYLIIQSKIEIWSLYPLFQFNSWGNWQYAHCTVMDAELSFLV